MQFHSLNGVLEYPEIEQIDENLIKIHVTWPDGGGEGPWAHIHPDDRPKYADDSSNSEPIMVRLANDLLLGVPYGTYVLCHTQGTNRPEMSLADLEAHLRATEAAPVQ